MPAMPNEAETRKDRIDTQLAQAGWSENQNNLRKEVQLGEGRLDYFLLDRSGKPLAIVEAKRGSRGPEVGSRQAIDYGQYVLARYDVEPFLFLSNGETILFMDREPYPWRRVAGFFTPADLERRLFQRQYSRRLESVALDPRIPLRDYQKSAIEKTKVAMETGQRKFLLVMATGTGKTRTVISLIDLLMRARWVQRVLFLADRRELVNQALGEFKELMPDETRARIEGGVVDNSARIHVATYPSMVQAYRQLSPGYYDLLVADESHRSIYNRYKELFDYFDTLQIGLTATPTDYIDHNTFHLFNCPDGLPTFYYPYDEAVKRKYLVNYRVLEAQTEFQLQGIKAGQLPPEFQRQLEEQGIDLNEIDFEGSDLERRVTNTGTNDAIVKEFMEKCRKDARGTLPAKTIIFATSHHHAVEIWESFNRLYPSLQGKEEELAQIIDSLMERAAKMLDDFKRKDMPRVAISVDMLDTGIDVPSIQNLVFAKPVFSQVKFWQMIGRGTRRWMDPQTGQEKADFLVIDYWRNFAYFKMNPQGEIASSVEPLPVRLFRLRLEKLLLLHGLQEKEAIRNAISQLQKMLEQVPTDNINVQPHLKELETLVQVDAWENLDSVRTERLSHAIAPLVRFLPDVNLPVMTFEAHVERLAIAHLAGQTEEVEKQQEQIVEGLRQLPLSLHEVQKHREELEFMISNSFWSHLDYKNIMRLQETFAPLMRYRHRSTQNIIALNLPDEITSRRWVIYGPSGEGAFVDTYRDQVEVHVKDLSEQLPALYKLKRGEELSESDVQTVVDTLRLPDLFVTENTLRQVYESPDATILDFVSHILGVKPLLNREAQIKAAFDKFIASHPYYTSTQVNYLRAIRSAILRRKKLTMSDLARQPFISFGTVQGLFKEEELVEILDYVNRLAG